MRTHPERLLITLLCPSSYCLWADGLAFWQGSQKIANSVSDGTSGTPVCAVFTVIFILIEEQGNRMS